MLISGVTQPLPDTFALLITQPLPDTFSLGITYEWSFVKIFRSSTLHGFHLYNYIQSAHDRRQNWPWPRAGRCPGRR